MKKLFISVFVVCLLGGVLKINASSIPDIIKNKIIKVGMAPEYTPFEFKNAKGEIKGFDYDIAKKMADELEVKLEIKQYKWSDLIPALKRGEIDVIISGMTRTLKRAREVNFTDPYFETGQVVIVPSSLSDKNIKDVKTCKFEKVGVVKNTTGEQAAIKNFPKCQITNFEDELKASDALINSKIDAFVFDRPLAEHLVRKNPKLNTLLGQLSTEYYSFVVKQGDFDLLLWMNYFISDIKSSGTFSELYNYWFIEREWEK